MELRTSVSQQPWKTHFTNIVCKLKRLSCKMPFSLTTVGDDIMLKCCRNSTICLAHTHYE